MKIQSLFNLSLKNKNNLCIHDEPSIYKTNLIPKDNRAKLKWATLKKSIYFCDYLGLVYIPLNSGKQQMQVAVERCYSLLIKTMFSFG